MDAATVRESASQALHDHISVHRQVPIALGSGQSNLAHKLRGAGHKFVMGSTSLEQTRLSLSGI
eukprot:2864268-Alexandrium_andersonii.AAC.1